MRLLNLGTEVWWHPVPHRQVRPQLVGHQLRKAVILIPQGNINQNLHHTQISLPLTKHINSYCIYPTDKLLLNRGFGMILLQVQQKIQALLFCV